MAERSMKRLKIALNGDQNLIPLSIEAVKAGTTTGEISDVVRETHGEVHPKTLI